MNYVYEIYKVLEFKGCDQISLEFDLDDKEIVVKYKRKSCVTGDTIDEMFNIVPKNYKSLKDLHVKVIRELYCICVIDI